MPGSTSQWDQSADPRDNTVDIPLIGPGGRADYRRRPAPLPDQETSRVARPSSLRHAYAEPGDSRPAPTWRAFEPPARADAAESARSLQATPEPDPKPAVSQATPDPGPAPTDADTAAAQAAPSSTLAAAAQQQAPAPPPVHVPPAEPGLPVAEPAGLGVQTRAQSRAAGLSSPGRAPAGSLADLRSRLARLPDGHPSSPYEDGGHAKALPIRLRQLELGLPAPIRELAGGVVTDGDAADIDLDPIDVFAEPEQREPIADVPESQATAAGAADKPAAEFHAEPSPLSGSRPTSAANDEPTPFRPDSDAGHPEPSRWTDPYADAGNGLVARGSAAAGPPSDLNLGRWRATPSPRTRGLDGLSRRAGNGHHPGNGHGDGSRQQSSQLGPEQSGRAPADAELRDTAQHRIVEPSAADLRELVERTLARCRTAEGRNVLGSYGSSGLTPALQRLAAHLPFGGLAPDSEANSLKPADSFAAKLARLIARNPGRTAEELAASIGDAVRYAFAFEVAHYVEGTWLVHRRLKSHGFELEIRRNRWESPERKGIFTQWRDPAHHLAFEVQFHTTASWAVVQRTHDVYVQITDPATPPAERARLRARQVAAAAAAKAPPNWADIGDFRLEAR